MILALLSMVLLGQSDTVLLTEALCPKCQVRLEQVATLGDSSGPGEIAYGTVLAIDPKGRFLVSHRGAPSRITVFDAGGRFVRTVGRRGGGPGEFTRIWAMAADAKRIVIYDDIAKRSTVMDLDFGIIQTRAADERPESIILKSDGSMVVSAIVPTPNEIGFALHEIDPNGTRVRSFAPVALPYREDLRELFVRTISLAADSQHIWIAHRREYAFQRCTILGSNCRIYLRDVRWFPAPVVSDFRRRNAAEDPPVPVVVGISEDGPGYVWTVSRVADPRWRQALEPINKTEYRIADDDRYFDSVVERVEVATGRIVASTRFDRVLYGFVGRGLLSYYEEDSAGVPKLKIVRLNVVTQP